MVEVGMVVDVVGDMEGDTVGDMKNTARFHLFILKISKVLRKEQNIIGLKTCIIYELGMVFSLKQLLTS